MTKLIAIHAIRHNWTGTMEFTGRFDKNGEPIIRSVATVIKPGELFEVPSDKNGEQERLLELGAARIANRHEIELRDAARPGGAGGSK
ncbi:MAG: hypothetical protein A2623_09515 [Caulobacterales bacterium RIFCSPHIGHO2_01_FULL_70_19]|nr:MAG: hypothetical protein A2623_09515 [Caulobacterales bacterium RIFCSPHIGHO2_01_FULL_70_19]